MVSKSYIWFGTLLLVFCYYNNVEASNCLNLWGDSFKDRANNLYLDGYSDVCPVPIIGQFTENEYCCYNYVLKPYCCPFGSFVINMVLIIGAVILILGFLGSFVCCVCCKIF